jgi:hypothetical protein
MTCERVPRLAIAFRHIPIATGPARLVVAAPTMLIRPLPFVSGTAAQRPCVIDITVARPRPRLAPVVIMIAVAGAVASSTPRRVGVSLVVSRVVVSRIETHGRATLQCMDAKQFLEQALRLPDEERAALAGELIQRLDSDVDADAEAAWSSELRARLARVDAGTARTVS